MQATTVVSKPLSSRRFVLKPVWRLPKRFKLAPKIEIHYNHERGTLTALVDDRYYMRTIRTLDLLDEDYDFGHWRLDNYATSNGYKYTLHLFVYRYDDRIEFRTTLEEYRLIQPNAVYHNR